MKSEIIIQLHKNFEDYAHEIDGVRHWIRGFAVWYICDAKWKLLFKGHNAKRHTQSFGKREVILSMYLIGA